MVFNISDSLNYKGEGVSHIHTTAVLWGFELENIGLQVKILY